MLPVNTTIAQKPFQNQPTVRTIYLFTVKKITILSGKKIKLFQTNFFFRSIVVYSSGMKRLYTRILFLAENLNGT